MLQAYASFLGLYPVRGRPAFQAVAAATLGCPTSNGALQLSLSLLLWLMKGGVMPWSGTDEHRILNREEDPGAVFAALRRAKPAQPPVRQQLADTDSQGGGGEGLEDPVEDPVLEE